jgi:transposase-like protein
MRESKKTLNPVLAKVLKRLHYPLEVILRCVRCYFAYPLSLRHLEEMLAERGIAVDHSPVHRWALKLLPVLEKAFRRRKRPVGKSWRMDETYARVKGDWKYSAAPLTRTATPSISCGALIVTRLQRGVTLKNRSPRMAYPRR